MKSHARTFIVALALCTAVDATAQTSPALHLLLDPVTPPMMSYTLIGRMTAVTPADVFEIEISDSGGITDIFIRLSPSATTALADWTALAVGQPMIVSLCGAPMSASSVDAPVTSGTFYIPNLNATQAEALRAVWQGRETCATLPPEVFPIDQ